MKEKILKTLEGIKREGMPEFLKWLQNETDFFTAPASTRFHGAEIGGLCTHSGSVCQNALILNRSEIFEKFNFKKESVILCALLHDICKVNYYKLSFRNVKNEVTGQWEKAPFYTIEDSHPYGHGECSVMLIEKFLKLTEEERYAIRWHMGGFDHSVRGGSYAINDAFQKFPLSLLIHMADLSEASCYFVQK
jgi:hypothetical protein